MNAHGLINICIRLFFPPRKAWSQVNDKYSSMDGEGDEYGIDPRTLEARLEGEITLDHW
jgi:hypothetical protein